MTSKRVAAKNAALAIAAQLNESVKAHTDESEDFIVSGELVLTFDIKEAVAEDDDYACTKKITVKLSADLSSDLMTHAYDAETNTHNVTVEIPAEYKAAYNAYMTKAIQTVFASMNTTPVATYAMRATPAFDLSNIDVNKYLTAEVVQALTNPNADQNAVYDVVDEVISNAVSAEQVNGALESNEDITFTLTDIVETLADETVSDSFKEDMATQMVEVAKKEINNVLVEQGYEEIATETFVDYAANTALNKVVKEEAEKIKAQLVAVGAEVEIK